MDITEPQTAEGKLYCCAIKDACFGRIVGYSIDSRMKSRLAVQALENAALMRGDLAGCIVHSDRGSQGGFNRSSQHLVIAEVSDGSSSRGSRSGGASDASVAWASEVPTSRQRSGRRSPRGWCPSRLLPWSAWRRRSACGGSVRLAACLRSIWSLNDLNSGARRSGAGSEPLYSRLVSLQFSKLSVYACDVPL